MHVFTVHVLHMVLQRATTVFFRCGSTMKGGGRGKEPPVAGEVTGKRPKRKCLQWHPLLSKKALDFSEEEEEEDEEELEKVSVFDTCYFDRTRNPNSGKVIMCKT